MSALISSNRVNYPAPFKLGYVYICEYSHGFTWEAFAYAVEENEGFVGANVSDFCDTREAAEFAAFAAIEDAVWGKA